MKPDKPKRKNSPKQVSQCIPKSSTPSHFKPSVVSVTLGHVTGHEGEFCELYAKVWRGSKYM